MSLTDRTNEEIPLAMPGQGTLSVDIDQDSHVWPEQWIWLMFDEGNDEHWAKLTLAEAGLLHDRLGLILGRPQDAGQPTRPAKYRVVRAATDNPQPGELVRSVWSSGGAVWRIDRVEEHRWTHNNDRYKVLYMTSISSGRQDHRNAANLAIVEMSA